jgi:mRNA degradation ribonuclease J1/J2
MLESLGATKKGLPPSETEVHTNLQNLIRSAPGRVIIGTFASQVRRIAYLIEYAERMGKRVALEGYSMKMNIEVAKELGYLKAKPETLITVNDIHKYPDNQDRHHLYRSARRIQCSLVAHRDRQPSFHQAAEERHDRVFLLGHSGE